MGLEEVIVTAQKRTEDMQKVPISLQVLGTQQLEEHQVANFDDFAKLLPSVTYQSLGPGQMQLYFRGIASGGDGLHAGSLPATGMYLDETPVTTVAGSLDIHIQRQDPGAEKRPNWLPTPTTGAFTLAMRLYWPKPEVASGDWKPPALQRMEARP